MFKALRARLAPTKKNDEIMVEGWDFAPTMTNELRDAMLSDAGDDVQDDDAYWARTFGLTDYIAAHPLRHGDYIDDEGVIVRQRNEGCRHWECYED